MKTSKKYTRELKRQFGYLATWLPSVPLELGDIGVLKRNIFTKIANLSDFGLSFSVEPDNDHADIEHSSKGAVSISVKASSSMPPIGSGLAEIDAGITVEFTKENAILFKANQTTSPTIKDQPGLGEKIIKLYKEGKWDKNWAVVTEVVNAESATILISSSKEGKIELKADGEVDAAKLDIADASLGLKTTFSKDLSTKIIARDALTPLFKASKVKGRFFGPPIFNLKKTHTVLNVNEVVTMDLITPNIASKNADLLYFGEADFEDEQEDNDFL